MSEKAREIVAFVPENVYSRIKKEIVREEFTTPYRVAEKYNMTISLARKVLSRLEREGVVKLYVKNRRTPIYLVVAKKEGKAETRRAKRK